MIRMRLQGSGGAPEATAKATFVARTTVVVPKDVSTMRLRVQGAASRCGSQGSSPGCQNMPMHA